MKGSSRQTRRFYLLTLLVSMFYLNNCTNSSTQNQITDIQRICLSPQDLPKSIEVELDGVITISTYNFDDPYYFIDLDTKNSYPVPFSSPDHTLWGGRISPNGEWIAFEIDSIDNNGNVIESKLSIINAHGQEIETMIWEEQWGVIRGWLDNERLFIDGWGPNLGKIFVVNPFMQHSQEINPAFPNLYNDYPLAYWSLMPNSELTLALYPNKQSKDENLGFNLWDINKKEKIWHQDSRTAPSVIPKWSPDQTQFVVFTEESVIENQAEVVIVDSSGNLVLQTDFSLKYSYVFIGDNEAWSFNGRYLFFWVSIGSVDNPPHTTSLAMLDLEKKTITDFCIKSYGIGNEVTLAQDGKWLITYSDEASSNILVDIFDKKAYLFPTPVDGQIDGWMAKP